MSAEFWYLVASAVAIAGGLIACSMVAWMSCQRARTSLERSTDGRMVELHRLIRALDDRLDLLERSGKFPSGASELSPGQGVRLGRSAAWPVVTMGRRQHPAVRTMETRP